MLDEYFKTRNTLERLRRGSIGAHVDGLTEYLRSRGFTWFTVKQYLGSVVHFGRWLDRSRLLLKCVDENMIARFASHLRRCRCRSEYRGLRCRRSSEAVVA